MDLCSTPKPSLFVLFLVLLFTSVQNSTVFAASPNDNTPVYEEAVVKERLASLGNDLLDYRYNPVVASYIRRYLSGRRGSEIILGRTTMYFPTFEKYLSEAGLPDRLKYLSIIESSLVPNALSRVGAKGLWQFMPATGKELGLKITRYVDDRIDPHKSTQAAMRYLQREYNRFGEWSLVLAAYNSGSGRVSRAIKRARTKDYWRLQRYLPSETRNYVPRFIAATYLVEYYDQHGLKPQYPELDMQLTETVQVFDQCSFYRIAQMTALPMEMIQALNPSYLQGFIPANPDGNYVTLPKRVMPVFKEYLSAQNPDPIEDFTLLTIPIMITAKPLDANAAYEEVKYTSKEGQQLEDIAKELNCTAYQLRLWNNLSNAQIQTGQELIIYRLKESAKRKPRAPKKIKEVATLPAPTIIGLHLSSLAPPQTKNQTPIREEYLYYTAKRKIRLSDVASELGMSHDTLLQLNGWVLGKILKPGERAKIKRLELPGQ